MVRASQIVRSHRPAKLSSREYTRCERCGRPHSVYRKFKLCRVYLKDLTCKDQVPDTKKISR